MPHTLKNLLNSKGALALNTKLRKQYLSILIGLQ